MSHYNGSSGPAHHGLINQGATCYLNSVLQVLFMTKKFREAVERNTSTDLDTEFIDPQLKSLFKALKFRTARTQNITKKLGIKRVHEQQDAAEVFEKILSYTSPKAAQIFQGVLTHKNTCSKCSSCTKNDDPFWSLPLALVDSENSVAFSAMEGIEKFFHSIDVSGDNQMYCDQCDTKTDAKINIEIKHHPDVLMLLLKRFQFDYRSNGYVKDTCKVEFPYTIQIQENQNYKLYAFVEHFGSLRSGHYTATINCQDDEKWYNFNDTMVTLADYQSFQSHSTEASRSAYLLFYRKKQTSRGKEGAQEADMDLHFEAENIDKKGKINTSKKLGSNQQGKKRRNQKTKNNMKYGQEELNFERHNRPSNSEDVVQEISDKSMRHEDHIHSLGPQEHYNVKTDRNRQVMMTMNALEVNEIRADEMDKKLVSERPDPRSKRHVEYGEEELNFGRVCQKRPANNEDVVHDISGKSMRHKDHKHSVGPQEHNNAETGRNRQVMMTMNAFEVNEMGKKLGSESPDPRFKTHVEYGQEDLNLGRRRHNRPANTKDVVHDISGKSMRHKDHKHSYGPQEHYNVETGRNRQLMMTMNAFEVNEIKADEMDKKLGSESPDPRSKTHVEYGQEDLNLGRRRHNRPANNDDVVQEISGKSMRHGDHKHSVGAQSPDKSHSGREKPTKNKHEKSNKSKGRSKGILKQANCFRHVACVCCWKKTECNSDSD